jgi:hypothetical protein
MITPCGEEYATVLRRCENSSPSSLEPAAHAGAAGVGAGPAVGLCFGARAHFVERRFVWGVAVAAFGAGAMWRDFVIERDAHFIEIGLVDAGGWASCL